MNERIKQLVEAWDNGVRTTAEALISEMRTAIEQAEKPATRPATREEKIVNPGVYEVKVEQEPFVWLEDDEGNKYEMPEANKGPLLKRAEEVFESAKKRQWVGLTDEEVAEVAESSDCFEDVVELTAAKLKEKNHHE